MRRKGFTLIELLVVVAIIALLISILLPSLARARELSKRTVCASQLSGIGKAIKTYVNDFDEWWPIAPCDKTAFNHISDIGTWRLNGDVPQVDPSIGQCLWILVKMGTTTNKMFVCPSSSDEKDTTANPMTYYDFEANNKLSYGYQYPYYQTGLVPGNRGVPTESNLNAGAAVMADKCNKTVTDRIEVDSKDESFWKPYHVDWDPDGWKQVNSTHHTDGEGQTVLYMDGHGEFAKKSACGVAQEYHPLTGDEYPHPDCIYESAWDTENEERGGYLGGDRSAPGVEDVWPQDANDSVVTHSPKPGT